MLLSFLAFSGLYFSRTSHARGDCYYRPLQVAILQDLTDGMERVCQALSDSDLLKLYLMLQALRVETEIGIMSFRDKPLWPLGNQATNENSYSDYCTKLEQPFTDNITRLSEWYASASAQGGGDAKGVQFYAIYRAVESYDFQWRPDADKLLILITDSPPHFAGDGSTDGMNLQPFSGSFSASDQADCISEDYPSADQVRAALHDSGVLSAYLVVNRDRALDTWNWFNEHIYQPPSLVQEIDFWGTDMNERFMGMLPAIAHALSCHHHHHPSSAPSEMMTTLPPTQSPTETFSSSPMPAESTLFVPTPTIVSSLPTMPTAAMLSSEASLLVSSTDVPTLPSFPAFPSFPPGISAPIVEYPTLPALIPPTGPMNTAELVALPPTPQVPGVGVESRGPTMRSGTVANAEKAFLARQTSATVATTTAPSVTRNCRQVTVELDGPHGSTETLEECEITDPLQMNYGQRTSLYECLTSVLPGTTSTGSSRVLIPSSPSYRVASIPYNLARPIEEPIAIIYVNSTEQAAAAVRCAAKHSVQVVPRSGGHDYSSFSFGTDRSAIIDVSEIDHIIVDQAAGTANIGPGARLGKVWYDIYNNGKYMLPLGACTTLGFGGHVLGGGYGFFSRAFGVASDYMLEAEVVLGNGTVITATYSAASTDGQVDSHHGELFWALRGTGNGHFGIVTNFKFQLIPAPEPYTSASLIYLGNNHREVIRAFAEWADEAPPGLGASLAAVKDRTGLQLAYPGTIDQFWTAVNPLVQRINATVYPFVRQGNWLEAAAELSIMNIYDVETPVALPVVRKVPTLEWLNSGPLTPVRSRFLCHSGFISLSNKLNTTGADIFDEILRDGPSEYGYTIELFSGQESRLNQPVDSGWPHRGMQFIFHMYIRALEPYNPAMQYAYLTDAYYHKLQSIIAPNVYANYHDFTLPHWLEHYYVQNLPRLSQIKALYDPSFVFWFPQVILPNYTSAAA